MKLAGDEGEPGQDEADEPATKKPKRNPPRAQPVIDPRKMLSTAIQGHTPLDSKPKPKRKRKAESEEEEQSAEEVAADGAWTLEYLQEVDPGMHEIADKHFRLTNKLAPCFFQLRLLPYLRGEKKAPVLTGVAGLDVS